MTTAALELDRVTKRFGTTEAVAGVSYAVGQGEMFGLIGPDGAGKTTTIRLLCGLLKSTSGSIRVLGHDPVRQHHAITTKVGYFSQKFSLYGDLTIDENIAFFAEIHGVSHYRERRDRLLDMMQLTPFRARLAERLSGGMKQKLALACTLVHEPQIILLDEPTTGVDPVSRREFWRLLSEFLSQGITIFMATPYLDEAERCSRVALMSEGRILALDEPNALRAAFPDDLLELRRRSEHRRRGDGCPLEERIVVDETRDDGSELSVQSDLGGDHPAGLSRARYQYPSAIAPHYFITATFLISDEPPPVILTM